MNAEIYTPGPAITMTESAVSHTRKKMQAAHIHGGLVLRLKTSGCSGYMYELELADKAPDDMLEIPVADDIAVYTDKHTLSMITGTEIDYVQEGLNAAFRFRNPNATAECGCGESFSIQEV